jgi:hypothetical protein
MIGTPVFRNVCDARRRAGSVSLKQVHLARSVVQLDAVVSTNASLRPQGSRATPQRRTRCARAHGGCAHMAVGGQRTSNALTRTHHFSVDALTALARQKHGTVASLWSARLTQSGLLTVRGIARY